MPFEALAKNGPYARPPIEATDGKQIHHFPIVLMTFVFFGVVLFGLGFWMRSRYKRNHHHDGVEGMEVILIAATILILFYGIFDRLTIL